MTPLDSAPTAPDACACCGPKGDERTIDGLLARLLPGIAPVPEVERVTLADARGRVLAEDLVARRPIPDFRRSAMDGYALRATDVAGAGVELLAPLRGRVAAGDSGLGLPDGPGIVRIFTGAALPPDCDRVVMQEDCRDTGGLVHVRKVPPAGANIRLPGDDMPEGAVAVRAGTRLGPRQVACAASLGLASVVVRRRPVVAVLSTGSELVEPGEPLRPGAIHNSNRTLIAGMLEEAGFDLVILPTVADDPDGMAKALRAAAACDAVVTSGGVSVGDEDHVRGAVAAAGGQIDHWRLAIKPGKPLAVGHLPRPSGGEALFLGLPGNPNAVFVTLSLVGLPLLRALAGLPYAPPPTLRARFQGSFRRVPGRAEYVSVTLEPGPDGIPAARRLGHGSSAQQSALAAADALLVVPASCGEVEDGALFDAIPLHAL